MRRFLVIACLALLSLVPRLGLASETSAHLYGDHGPIGLSYTQTVKDLSAFSGLKIECGKTSGKPGEALRCHGLVGDEPILFHIMGRGECVHFIEFYMNFPITKADMEIKLRILSALIGNAFNYNQAIFNWFNSVIDRVVPKGGHDLVVFGDKQLVVEYRLDDKELIVSINKPR